MGKQKACMERVERIRGMNAADALCVGGGYRVRPNAGVVAP